MIETLIYPEWITYVIAITGLIGAVGIGAAATMSADDSAGSVGVGLIGVLGLVLAGIVGLAASEGTILEKEEFNNPVLAAQVEKSESTLDVEEFKNRISKSADVDKVSFDESVKDSLFENLSNEEFVDFTAIKDGEIFDGKVYFTKDSMVINIAVESDNVNVIKVPVND